MWIFSTTAYRQRQGSEFRVQVEGFIFRVLVLGNQGLPTEAGESSGFDVYTGRKCRFGLEGSEQWDLSS